MIILTAEGILLYPPNLFKLYLLAHGIISINSQRASLSGLKLPPLLFKVIGATYL